MSLSRLDGRGYEDLRDISISFDGLARVDGSARFGFGETQALASISGPIEVRLAAEHPSRATFEVIVRPLANLPGTESKSLSATLRSLLSPSVLLTQNPRTLIQLVVQSLTPTSSTKFHSSLIATMINASSLALLSAGSVAMRGVVCAVSIGRMHLKSSESAPKPILIVDPGEGELPSLEGGGCFAFLVASGINSPQNSALPDSEPVWSNWQATTPFTEDEIIRARDLAKKTAFRVWITMKESIEQMEGPRISRSYGQSPQSEKTASVVHQPLTENEEDDRMYI